jgi:hypothetical protein
MSCLGEEELAVPSGTLIACSLNKYARWLLSLIFLLSISSASPGQPQAKFNDQASQLVIQGDSPMGDAYEPKHQEAGDQHRYEDLLAKARTHGSVRVIVRLKLDDWKPEGELLPHEQAVAVQREAIANLQARLLNTMTSFGVSDVKQFTFVPQVAMKVNATGLQDLLSNPDVTGIWEDMSLAPGR